MNREMIILLSITIISTIILTWFELNVWPIAAIAIIALIVEQVRLAIQNREDTTTVVIAEHSGMIKMIQDDIHDIKRMTKE